MRIRVPPTQCVLLACGISMAASVDVPPSNPAVRILARTLQSSPQEVQWSWSGSGALIAFEGTSCSALLSSRGAFYRVMVDGVESKTIDLSSSGDTLIPLVSGLAAGKHVVEIRQRTEAQYSTARFHGFRIDGIPGIAPPESSRRIEFYGNSITCGYGILDTDASHPFATRTEDEGRTFAALASDSLGADRRVVCWSGKGVLQNYGGDRTYPTLPKLHAQILAKDSKNLWDFTRWTPDVVVVDLGTNDYSTVQPDSAAFYQAYLGFVDALHSHYSQARIVLVDGPMLSGTSLAKLRAHIDRIVEVETAKGVQISHLKLTPAGSLGYGADWHPSQAQARLNGKELTAHIREIAGWTGKSSAPPRERDARSIRLEATSAGWSIRIAENTSVQNARLLDAAGRVIRYLELVPGSSTPLPSLHQMAWLGVSTPDGTKTLTILPRMR